MEFNLDKTIELLRQTPYSLERMLSDLSEEWTCSDGDESSWTAYDVIGHLIHGEETDWIPRAKIILSEKEDRRFVPFDRLAQFRRSRGKSLPDLLTEFAHLRNGSLEQLAMLELTDEDLERTAEHPELGTVTLKQLLATWAVHDLNHVRQIATALAKRYESSVGPWREYLSILN
jgi:hypothetical protein